jgi:hypothetical protein
MAVCSEAARRELSNYYAWSYLIWVLQHLDNLDVKTLLGWAIVAHTCNPRLLRRHRSEGSQFEDSLGKK